MKPIVDLNKLNGWKAYIIEHAIDIGIALLIAIIGVIIIEIVHRSLMKRVNRNITNKALKQFILKVVRAISYVLLLIIVLNKLGIPTASLLTVLGASTLAIALGLKESLANVAAGVIIIFQKPIRAGDYVEAFGAGGTVDRIGFINTKLIAPNNDAVYIPNAKLLTDKIVNKTRQGTRRIDMEIGISYNANILKAKQIVEDILANHEKVLKTPEPYIGVKELANSAVVLAIRPWVNKDDYLKTYYGLNETIKNTFDNNGIGIPFPQMDVHLNKID